MNNEYTQVLEVVCQEDEKSKEYHVLLTPNLVQQHDELAGLFTSMMQQYPHWATIMLKSVQDFLADKSTPKEILEGYIEALKYASLHAELDESGEGTRFKMDLNTYFKAFIGDPKKTTAS